MHEHELISAQREVIWPGRPKHARQGPEVGLLGLQRKAGNAAVSRMVRHQRGPRLVPQPVQRMVVHRCGCGGTCGCKGGARAGDQAELISQPGGIVQRAKPPNYKKTHMCGPSETARIVSSWAVAIAKLVENLPALDFAMTGLHTPLLKRKLKQHFKANTKKEREKVLNKILPRYHMILLKMGPALVKVRCGGTSCDHNDYAYTSSGSSNSTIWLCNQEFTKKPILDLAATWIHELSHSLYDTDDNGYYTYTGSTKLGLDDSLKEADCYGNFMVDYT